MPVASKGCGAKVKDEKHFLVTVTGRCLPATWMGGWTGELVIPTCGLPGDLLTFRIRGLGRRGGKGFPGPEGAARLSEKI